MKRSKLTLTSLFQREQRRQSFDEVLDMDSLYQIDTVHSGHGHHSTLPLRSTSYETLASHDEAGDAPKKSRPLGRPTVKKRLNYKDAAAALVSLASCTAAVLVVANEAISWHLAASDSNYQLIVIGVLLSIMNLCLNSVAPTMFLVLEAQYGASLLQNYDGIIRNQPLATSLSFIWRVAMFLMLVLPIGLSIAYKTFSGGQSAVMLTTSDYIASSSYGYGMFPPPGVQSLGMRTGLSLMSNATIPFLEKASLLWNGTEPPDLIYPSAYGYNILSISPDATAILDIPMPGYITAVQELLSTGESWSVTANVAGTVATISQNETSFEAICHDALETDSQPWVYTTTELYIGYGVALLNKNPEDNSALYIGVVPQGTSCLEFYDYARMYAIQRHMCRGTWSITRAGIKLLDGSCDAEPLSSDDLQQVITDNQLFLQASYQGSMNEMLGQFSDAGALPRGNASVWYHPSTATCVAAMAWSRITALDLQPWLGWPDTAIANLMTDATRRIENGTLLTYQELGIAYPPVEETVLYLRPALQKRNLLYLVFVVQPVLVVVVLAVRIMLHRTPVDTGFGLVAILSGIVHQSCDGLLTGATLSGELQEPVKLVICPLPRHASSEQEGVLEYHLTTKPDTTGNGKLVPKVKYY